MHSKPDIIDLALSEDLGPGDITSQFFIPPTQANRAVIKAKQPAVIAGLEVAAEVFRRVDSQLRVELLCQDGERVEENRVVLQVVGATASILSAERVALNFLQRLSGVATMTRSYVEAIAGTKARILDTRKTTPGWRVLEKAAVRAGGGYNHRMGLFDMVMVKDNHLAACPDIESLQHSIDRIRALKPGLRVELEADHTEQVEAFLQLHGVDVILLDNMSVAQLRQAVALRGSLPVELEASGGITLQTIRDVAATGVDWISVGALTHSATAVDLSLELLSENESA